MKGRTRGKERISDKGRHIRQQNEDGETVNYEGYKGSKRETGKEKKLVVKKRMLTSGLV